jgi:radical SAM-linked protein
MINKNITEEEILQTAQTVFDLGWRVLKLYFMIGLPSETQEDLEGLVLLVKKIEKAVRKKGGRIDIHVALSTFIPKPHTPFQWAGQLPMEETLERLAFIRSALNGKHIQVKWNDTRQSFLEGNLSRGDQEMGRVIYRAFQKGSFLDGWGEYFSWPIWQQAFEEEEVESQRYLKAHDRDDSLPWDFIHTGVEKDYLWNEYQKGMAGESTPDCRQGECNQCGVCSSLKVKPLLFKEFTIPSVRSAMVYPKESVKKFRFLITKTESSRFLGHLEWKEAIIRSLRRAELPLAFSQGFHPMPRLSFGPALPLGISSLGEFIDIQLLNWPNGESIKKRLPEELFPGTKILAITEVPLNSSLPQMQVYQYQVELEKSLADEERVKEFLSSTYWPVEKSNKKPEPFNLRPMIRTMTLLPENNGTLMATWTLEPGPEGEIRPELILKSVFNLPDEVIQGLIVVKSLAVSN